MATKIPAAQKRMFKNIFVCRNCGQKMKTESLRVIARTVRCRRCGRNIFRPKRHKKK